MQFWAPDDGRKTRLKHLQRLTEINKLWNVASCWSYSANIQVLAMHGPMNVKGVQGFGLFEVNSLTVIHAFSRFRFSHSAFSRFCIQKFTNMIECWKVYRDIYIYIFFFAHFGYHHGFRHSAPLSYTGNISESLEHSFPTFRSQISPKMKTSDSNKYKLGSCKGSKESLLEKFIKMYKRNYFFRSPWPLLISLDHIHHEDGCIA